MYAVMETGGKQYKVKKGDRITVEKLGLSEGEKVVFDRVLIVDDGGGIRIGTPYVDDFTVEGNVVCEGKGKKIVIFKYKAKKNYRKKQGHRQPYTSVEITDIISKKTKAAAVSDDDKAEKGAVKKKPSLRSMKKAQLIEFAKENNIEMDEKATNAVMIETIEAALNEEK